MFQNISNNLLPDYIWTMILIAQFATQSYISRNYFYYFYYYLFAYCVTYIKLLILPPNLIILLVWYVLCRNVLKACLKIMHALLVL